MNNETESFPGDGISSMDREALAMLSSFRNSDAGREFSWRCVRSLKLGPEIHEDSKGEILGALSETKACQTFFFVVGGTLVPFSSRGHESFVGEPFTVEGATEFHGVRMQRSVADASAVGGDT